MNRYKTPLRYPGGKQRLAPFILELLAENDMLGGDYVEPFAGGAGIAIELLLGGHTAHVHLNDLSVPVYSFWRALLTKTEEFCRRVSRASLTVDEWHRQKQILRKPSRFSQLDVGFSLFFLNRCNRSGIPSGGLIGGVHQNGEWRMDARFPRNELIRRIEAIADRRDAITIKNWDAEKFILEYVSTLPKRTLVYCDPPYFRKSERLYLNHYEPQDHKQLARTIQRHLKHPWVVSYDETPEIIEAYSKRTFFSYSLQYNAARAYKGTEVFLFSDKLRVPAASSVGCIQAALDKIAS
jgi:DNA adenine methylase